MTPVVAVIAPGMMGAAVGKRLVDNGVKVLTSLKGRSAETATRAGSADALFAELSSSQKEMFAWFKRGLALMPPKAYRWVAEMHEIASFVGEDPTAHELYEGAAHFYERMAEDFDGGKKDVTALMEFLGKNPAGN